MKKTIFKEELKKLGFDDLKSKIGDLRRELFGVRLKASTAHVKDYSQVKKLRRDIARALTQLRQQEV